MVALDPSFIAWLDLVNAEEKGEHCKQRRGHSQGQKQESRFGENSGLK